ncbi:CIA30 family protein [Aquimarina celericrescens]|uniref:CIA30 family protein n=1 Tax=Aquimarina celericrescens TaxID=1964542 RepID=A0ABW5AY21_9FLAO|nr:CIA30 family protein [Aquimarina celericrescens]
MKYLFCIIILLIFMNSLTIFDFSIKSDIQDWRIVDDVVMGGRSSSSITLNTDGFGVFKGYVSLENNGGFSSVRYQFEKTEVKRFTKIILKLKGDGKKYQFRVKPNSTDYYSYIMPFSTSGELQEIEITLRDMYPSFRGRKLDQPNFSANHIEEITFLIGNKKAEEFKLLIDKIELK